MAEESTRAARRARQASESEKTIVIRKKTKKQKPPKKPLRRRFKRPFISLRWRIIITYSLVLGLALLIAGLSYIRIISDYMLQEEHATHREVVADLALRMADLMEAADGDGMYQLALEQGQANNGRVLVLDAQGRILVDSFSRLEGLRMTHKEVRDVLRGETEFGVGVYHLDTSAREIGLWQRLLSFFSPQEHSSIWTGYYTAGITTTPLDGGSLDSVQSGLVFLSIPLQRLMDDIAGQRTQILAIFLLVTLSVAGASMLFSRLITQPIIDLTQSIKRTAQGDFSQRVHPKGNNELAQLGKSFNIMSEKLQKLDSTRNQFISNASHELKTPLTTIKLLVQSLLHERYMEIEVREEFLSDINSEIDRLSHIISDLLTLVQIDSEDMVLRRENILFGELVRATVRRLVLLAQSHKINLDVTVAEDIHIYADSSRIEQVVYNLVDNAIKYTPEGGLVRIDLSPSEKTAVLRVADTGMGIPADDLPHIFDRFYRVDKARSRATGGTGLGLSIVQQIVLLHGGEILALSQEGQGSTFVLQLPIAEISEEMP